jgi:hypothetical protein
MGCAFQESDLSNDLRKEGKMTDTVHHHCMRPWYMRPPVWVLGLVVVALVVFGIVELLGSPAVTPG